MNIFRKESLDAYLGADRRFAKTLSGLNLMTLGIATIIGTGIFILPGTVAATTAGPGVTLSFLLAAIVCSLAAMCYAEFASSLPVAGSAYSYGNVIFGEIIGWLLGWALILEYMLAVAAVSTGWSAYFQSLLASVGLKLPTALTASYNPAHGTYINLIAVLIVVLVGWIVAKGIRETMRINNIMVVLKLAIILVFIGVGLFFIKPANYQSFMPYHFSGVLKGATAVFFAFLGFDVVAASSAEVKNPQRNMPLGIIGSLLVAALLYMGVSIVLTGMVKYTHLDVANPVAFALNYIHHGWLADLLSIGALIGMFTMLLSMTYSSSRLVYSMGRDGLLPKAIAKIDHKQQPHRALWTVVTIVALMGGLVSLDQLANLVNFGTLLAFTAVSFGILPLRKRQDIPNRGFKVPLYPVLPIISGLACLTMICFLSKETLIAAGIWFAIGLILYLTYGYHHSRLNQK